ncbi:MAG: peptidase, partial [Herpetosiphonaceae bacterium]|nr:peptidase [Herpetosiphonaceae bacterium]
MARSKRNDKASQAGDLSTRNYQAGYQLVSGHPLFSPLLWHSSVVRQTGSPINLHGWASVTSNGVIYVHPTRRAEPAEWAYVLAHCLLHLGFGHFQQRPQPLAWNAACDSVIASFLANLKFGRPPEGFVFQLEQAGNNEEQIYRHLCERGLPPGYFGDLIHEPLRQRRNVQPHDWVASLGTGLSAAVSAAVELASGRSPSRRSREDWSEAEQARAWFINSYPLLGALAASFEIIENTQICQRMGISVAAVDMQQREIYINPAAGLTNEELRFVMAHELLHVGLRHDVRCQGRDPYLWNIACDYVINGWLIELGVGQIPAMGLLYDAELQDSSAEAVYDLIVGDMRRFRKLATLRGIGLSDILGADRPDWWTSRDGMDLDAFYRRCLSQGLQYHESSGRGFLPSGMIEEIRALEMPVIRWDVQLARWFDRHFAPLEKRRSYARQSRRQAATPDIPRPRYVFDERWEDGRTFGVVLDTSGSMERHLLAMALGTIASYS